MSIADHFEHAPDAGFVRDYDSNSARRQFKLSLVLLVAFALAITALSALIRFDSPSRIVSSGDGPVPSYAGKL